SVPPTTAPASPTAGSLPDTCPDLMVIPCQFQSAELSIPIVGTAFSLHYSSTRAPGRKVAPSDPAATDLGGWTISVLAHLDVKAGVWLGGDGTRRRVAPIRAGDQLVVASADAQFADVFDGAGREIRRIDAFTKVDLERFTWDGDKLITITDARGSTMLQRDASGVPTAIVGPLGATTAISLDGDGNLGALLRQSGRV